MEWVLSLCVLTWNLGDKRAAHVSGDWYLGPKHLLIRCLSQLAMHFSYSFFAFFIVVVSIIHKEKTPKVVLSGLIIVKPQVQKIMSKE